MCETIGRLQRQTGGAFLRVVAEYDLTLTQLKTLHALDAHDSLPIGELGTIVGISFAAISRAVEGLVQAGFVERSEDADDRRHKRARLTATGREALGQMTRARIEGIEQALERLAPDERSWLAGALELLVAPVAEAER